jgi:hypothetical protein
MSPTLAELAACSRAELRARFEAGHRVAPEALAGWVYDGVALGNPAWAQRLSWTKFRKAFAPAEQGVIRGWNQACVQTPLSEPWADRLRGGAPVRYWPYRLVVESEARWPSGHATGAYIDYRPENGVLSAVGLSVDPLVALDGPEGDLLLSYTAVVLAGRAWPTPTWFALRRAHHSDLDSRAP